MDQNMTDRKHGKLELAPPPLPPPPSSSSLVPTREIVGSSVRPGEGNQLIGPAFQKKVKPVRPFSWLGPMTVRRSSSKNASVLPGKMNQLMVLDRTVHGRRMAGGMGPGDWLSGQGGCGPWEGEPRGCCCSPLGFLMGVAGGVPGWNSNMVSGDISREEETRHLERQLKEVGWSQNCQGTFRR
ncbi:hypothetical protein GQ43DRAFT_180029 [Delitschia confertaspora ATCC 74209]|uniref:Uncharacterized protein n=1 Tax=Delitschia confertaspora ATCC 74209 TaxID=1513339 RepID=A0A9P4JK68_9PLEO|nr:hypothetical protein GQ43DRAFT_180029 [Delitschia confertaspora ATCC 74209]